MSPTQSNVDAPVPTSVVGRVFSLLRAFAESGRADLPLAELAARTSLPKSTVHRTVGQLLDEGALERTDRGYRLGLGMFELGSLVPRQRRLREVALPFIEDLYEATHQTIHFGVLDQQEVLYLERINGHDAVACSTRTGGRMPAHCTGLGKALLAFSPAHVVDEVVASGLPAHTPHTLTRPDAFRDHLAEIARTGVAYDREEGQPGVSCAAAPILDRSGEPVAAISVTTRSTGRHVGRFAGVVERSAARLSAVVRQMPDSFWRQSDLGVSLVATCDITQQADEATANGS